MSNSHHHQRLTGELREAVQGVITRGLADPRISGLITVTEVELAQDQRTATVWVSVLPGDRERASLAGLAAAARHVRHEISDRMRNLRVPDLHFKPDHRPKKQAEVFEALQRAADERQARNPQPAPDADTTGQDAKPAPPHA